MDNLDDGWLAHIRGCAQLIQLRGPSRHQTDFDRELLYAQEGFIVSHFISIRNITDDMSKSGDALMNHVPSFLDCPSWQDTLRALQQPFSKSFFANSLKEINQITARLSTLLNKCDLFFRTDKSEIAELATLSLFQRFIGLQGEIRERLKRDPLNTITEEALRSTAILEAKQALALLVVDTWLLKLLDFVGDDCSLMFCLVLPNRLKQHGIEPINHFRARLENEIDTTFTLLHGSLLCARRATPFSTRKMAFMCRVMCADMKSQVDRHLVWDRLRDVVDEINGAWCPKDTRV